jgi:hypothetical protein
MTYKGELNFTLANKMRFGVKADVFDYSVDKNSVAWHKPKSKITFLGSVNLANKINLSSEVYFMNGIIAKAPLTDAPIKLNSIVDINFKAEYRFSNKFSAFLSANNLLSKNYQRFLYYPSKGINILAGISFSF